MALKYWLWLTCLPGLRNQSRLALLDHFLTPENIYFADPTEFTMLEGLDRQQAGILSNHSLDTAERVLERCQTLNIRLLTLQDADYPDRLRNIYDPPCLLYVRGHLPPLDGEIVISVVGTRSCTPYGMACAERIGYGLATGGAIVASGLARGVDSAAVRGALLAGGVPVGLLGNGLDVVYPRENGALYEDVAAAGALISEYPPGTGPLPGNFPVRNRILSGISVGTLVVEAPVRSGALITASRALEQGRDVFAVPGPVDSPASQGCNRLIQDGAALVMDAADILEAYAPRFPEKLRPSREIPVILWEPVPKEPSGEAGTSETEQAEPLEPVKASGVPLPMVSVEDGTVSPQQVALLRLLDPETPLPTDELIERSGFPARQVLASLTMLQIDGFVREHTGKRYTRLVAVREDAQASARNPADT